MAVEDEDQDQEAEQQSAPPIARLVAVKRAACAGRPVVGPGSEAPQRLQKTARGSLRARHSLHLTNCRVGHRHLSPRMGRRLAFPPATVIMAAQGGRFPGLW